MMHIGLGTPVSAPRGYKSLEEGVIYYFLRSSPSTRLVTLVQFSERESQKVFYEKAKKQQRTVTPLPLPILIRLQRVDFESGIYEKFIVAGEYRILPPWLYGLEGLNLDAVDDGRRNPAKSHQDRIDAKLLTFHLLLPHVDEILDSEDAEKIINKHARTHEKQQNESRVRLWFLVYIVFGRNRYALHYPIHQLGHWDRLLNQGQTKRGAPSLKGAGYGYNTSPEMLEKIKTSYRHFAGIGVEEEQLYVDAMKKFFGCKSRWLQINGRKKLEIYHPGGEEFPQKGAYFYHVNKCFRPHLVRGTRLGDNLARSKIKPFLGAFTESSWNLMQRVEADGYYVYDLPKGYVEGSDLKPMVVVIKRDTASGKKTGIGFAVGGEKSTAYRMATFAEAIGLKEFGRLLGMIVEEQGKGVSPYDITDRGPGCTPGAFARSEEFRPAIQEATPSYAGQSKAIVETSNPKMRADKEAPSYRRSGMTVIELARREFGKLLEFNEATNVANRVDPELESKVTRLSPNGVWEALSSVGRNNAVQIGFDDAVRAYLEVVPAVLTRGGLALAGRNYQSATAEFQDALSVVAGGQEINLKVYILTACIRHIWFEWNNRLIELTVTYPIPVSEVVKNMSFPEAIEYAEYMKKRVAEHRGHQRAAKLYHQEQFLDQTGSKLHSGSRVAGRPKRGGAIARQEMREAVQSVTGKKAA